MYYVHIFLFEVKESVLLIDNSDNENCNLITVVK